MGVEPGQDRRQAGRAEAGRHVAAAEGLPLRGEPIEVGGPDVRVAHEGVVAVPLIVGDDHHDVRRRVARRPGGDDRTGQRQPAGDDREGGSDVPGRPPRSCMTSWQRLPPGQGRVGQAPGDIGPVGREVPGLPGVVGEVVQLGPGPVGVDEQLPVAVADGDVRAAVPRRPSGRRRTCRCGRTPRTGASSASGVRPRRASPRSSPSDGVLLRQRRAAEPARASGAGRRRRGRWCRSSRRPARRPAPRRCTAPGCRPRTGSACCPRRPPVRLWANVGSGPLSPKKRTSVGRSDSRPRRASSSRPTCRSISATTPRRRAGVSPLPVARPSLPTSWSSAVGTHGVCGVVQPEVDEARRVPVRPEEVQGLVDHPPGAVPALHLVVRRPDPVRAR